MECAACAAQLAFQRAETTSFRATGSVADFYVRDRLLGEECLEKACVLLDRPWRFGLLPALTD
ncbi:hypothetical protein OAO87_01055 [bacterium]|nr:hypothetical protein [bacterium]